MSESCRNETEYYILIAATIIIFCIVLGFMFFAFNFINAETNPVGIQTNRTGDQITFILTNKNSDGINDYFWTIINGDKYIAVNGSELNNLSLNKRYLCTLTNTEWFFNPNIGGCIEKPK